MAAIPPATAPTPSVRGTVAFWIILFLSSCFYVWTAYSAHNTSLAQVRGFEVSRHCEDYYPVLSEGFRHGHLYMAKEPARQLLALDDPWDPAKAGKWRYPDATYFKGRFYLYFGPVPALVLFLPLKLLTGYYLSHSVAVALLATLGLWVNALLIRRIWRRHFPAIPSLYPCAALLTAAFATTVPQLLRRPDVWEVAIACSYLAVSLAFWGAYQFALDRRLRWLAWTSLLLGLAVGSRPTFVVGFLALGTLAVFIAWGTRAAGSWARPLLRASAASATPFAAILLLLLLYNYERFDNPLEFGQRYQMHARDERHVAAMSPRFIAFNFRVYVLCRPRFKIEFPYIEGIQIPTPPPGQLGFENVFGLVPTEPVLCFALVPLALLLRRRESALPAPLRGLAVFAGALGVLSAGFIFLFAGACSRYQVDFAPCFALVAGLGILAVGSVDAPSLRRRAVSTLVLVLCIASVVLSALISIEHNGILQGGDEQVWRTLSRIGNAPAYLVDGLLRIEHGAVRIKTTFPDREAGREKLLVVGNEPNADSVIVDYLPGHRVQFSLDHKGFGGPKTEPISVTPLRSYRVTLEMGSLFPEYDFQFYRRDTSVDSSVLRMRALISVDGRILLNRLAAFEEHPLQDIHWGWKPAPDGSRAFTGKVTAMDWAPYNQVPLPRVPNLPVTLDVMFPPQPRPARDVLVATGSPGNADILYIEYVDDTHVSFGVDHWSVGAKEWGPFETDLDISHRLTIAMGSFLGGSAPDDLTIIMDGKRLVHTHVPFYPVKERSVYVGYAPFLNSSTGLEFSGKIRPRE